MKVAEKIVWSLSAQVSGGPAIAASNILNVDAYDKIGVTLEPGVTKTAEVQPGGEDRVRFLLISADQFGEDLTFKVADAAATIKLEAPLVLIGDGAVDLLDTPPQSISFTNDTQNSVNIDIIVGRMATT
jgi:hypothetical protein